MSVKRQRTNDENTNERMKLIDWQKLRDEQLDIIVSGRSPCTAIVTSKILENEYYIYINYIFICMILIQLIFSNRLQQNRAK